MNPKFLGGYWRVEVNCWPPRGTGEPLGKLWINLPVAAVDWPCKLHPAPPEMRRIQLATYNKLREIWKGDAGLAKYEWCAASMTTEWFVDPSWDRYGDPNWIAGQ